MFNAQKIAHFCKAHRGGITFSVDVSDRGCTVAGAKVLEVGMCVSTQNDAEDSDEATYCDGDMYVGWNIGGLPNDESACTTDRLLLQKLRSETVMGEFYWNYHMGGYIRTEPEPRGART